jgi:cysteine synthase
MSWPSFNDIMARRNVIMQQSLGLNYQDFELGRLDFDYQGLMATSGHTLQEIMDIQRRVKVGDTPLYELRNLTDLSRCLARPGYGATILLKDEACNASGSFKARRASLTAHQASERGYKGLIAATSGNYGAAVASQARMLNLDCIIVQEAFDSRGFAQPEIIEKGRKCEAYGAEVWQLSVGPELFYAALVLLEQTGYFNASLYTPYAVAGIETLGHEIGRQVLERYGRPPTAVLVTHAGGGNVTGTARGLGKAGCSDTEIVGVSVDLSGLHMASDGEFNKKSFTTGHTGFGVPFAVQPDRVDVPRNAARSLRYMDRYVVVTQGEVFYITEALAQLEGVERGPAGNTSLTAAIAIAQELPRDAVIVVQETEYTGAGKHPTAQLDFARQMGIEVRRGDPRDQIPGERIIIPEHPSQLRVADLDMDTMRVRYLRGVCASARIESQTALTDGEVDYLAAETNVSAEALKSLLDAAFRPLQSDTGGGMQH